MESDTFSVIVVLLGLPVVALAGIVGLSVFIKTVYLAYKNNPKCKAENKSFGITLWQFYKVHSMPVRCSNRKKDCNICVYTPEQKKELGCTF